MQGATGKGLVIRQWRQVGSTPAAVVRRMRLAGYGWVLRVVAWGANAPRVDSTEAAYLSALRTAGIPVWLFWGLPKPESWRSVLRPLFDLARQHGCPGVAIDPEMEWQDHEPEAQEFCDAIAAERGGLKVAITSYSMPSFHPRFPWAIFAAVADLGIAQTYDRDLHFDPGYPARCVREWQERGFQEVYPSAGLWAHSANRWKSVAELTRHLAQLPEALGVMVWSAPQRIPSDVWAVLARWRRAAGAMGIGGFLAALGLGLGIAAAAGAFK